MNSPTRGTRGSDQRNGTSADCAVGQSLGALSAAERIAEDASSSYPRTVEQLNPISNSGI